MRFIILVLTLSFLPVSAQACEGFNNGMNALESAIKQSAAPQTQTIYRDRNSPKGPPIAAINAQIDELEAALKQHKAEQTAQSYPRRKKPL